VLRLWGVVYSFEPAEAEPRIEAWITETMSADVEPGWTRVSTRNDPASCSRSRGTRRPRYRPPAGEYRAARSSQPLSERLVQPPRPVLIEGEQALARHVRIQLNPDPPGNYPGAEHAGGGARDRLRGPAGDQRRLVVSTAPMDPDGVVRLLGTILRGTPSLPVSAATSCSTTSGGRTRRCAGAAAPYRASQHVGSWRH
jgi:hypothetical protein